MAYGRPSLDSPSDPMRSMFRSNSVGELPGREAATKDLSVTGLHCGMPRVANPSPAGAESRENRLQAANCRSEVSLR